MQTPLIGGSGSIQFTDSLLNLSAEVVKRICETQDGKIILPNLLSQPRQVPRV